MAYAGNISPSEAWGLLQGDAKAQLVDVRTVAEWSFVGVPDTSKLGRAVILAEWQTYPGMARNPQFETVVAERLKAAGATFETPVAFLCRSGARSQSAAVAMTAAGYVKCFNVAGGFEGDLNAERHRGETGGWKSSGLPWVQT
ncbi:MAG: rhodanese-like domain-containing protein [Alphaproteobacteria bacterium]|nr:rhodanese-like domain-containing protein [Alphaproteobacteria bacterium]